MKDFLKKALGKDEKFYELLEASADEAAKSAKAVARLSWASPTSTAASPNWSSRAGTTSGSG